MVGEDAEELHRAAESLGISRSRAQDKGRTLHYDLHEEGRQRAIELGVAQPITCRELVALRRRELVCAGRAQRGPRC